MEHLGNFTAKLPSHPDFFRDVDPAKPERLPPALYRNVSRGPRSVRHSRCAEHAPIAFDLRHRPERFRIIVGEPHRRPPFDVGHFADQADRIKFAAASGIAAAEIVGQ